MTWVPTLIERERKIPQVWMLVDRKAPYIRIWVDNNLYSIIDDDGILWEKFIKLLFYEGSCRKLFIDIGND